MRTKVVSFFIFFQELSNKTKIKALRPKMTKIASRGGGGPALNEQHPTIKFEMELPDNNGYLPILDIKLNIDQDGNIHHKLYTKPASKGITLNFHSHHPSSVKRAVVANEFKRAQLCASAEHRAGHTNKTNAQQLPVKLDQSSHTTPT